MGLFDKKKNGGFLDVIRCDEPSYLIWKWHPSGVELGEGNRENSIRYGSSLRVKDGEVAVFVYKQKDGTMQDYIVGPYDFNALAQMVSAGTLTKETLVWKQGMANWAQAGTVQELQTLFNVPPIPTGIPPVPPSV